MPEHDLAWSRYADLQQQNQQSQHLNDHTWGNESALNWLLASIANGTVPSNPAELDAALKRAIASGGRLRRSRSSMLRRWAVESNAAVAHNPAEANIELAQIERSVEAGEASILFDAANGYTPREIAHRCASTPGAVRVRLMRLRRRLRLRRCPQSHSLRRKGRVRLTITSRRQ